MSDDRPSAYWEDDTLVIRASAIGGCMWELIACAQGIKQNALPQTLVRAFQEGHDLEPMVLEKVKLAGFDLYGEQREGNLRIAPNCIVRYHPDALGVELNTGTNYVIEIKCLNNDLWRRAKRHGVGSVIKEYNWQLSAMMIAEDLPGMWVIYNKLTGEVLWQEVPTPIINRAQFIQRALEVIAEIKTDLTQRPCDDPKHWPCRFLSLRPEPEEVFDTLNVGETGLEDEFNELARQYVFLKGSVDEMIQRRKEVGRRLAELAGNFKAVRSDRFHMVMVNGKNVHADREAMREDGVEDKYLRETAFTYPKVRGTGASTSER